MELTGTTALVTGAAGGIGRALVGALTARGARVKATDRDAAGLAALAAACGVEILEADLADDDGLDRLLAWAGDGVDLLVNNAGFGWYGPLAAVTPHEVDELIRVDLVVPVRLMAALTPAMVSRGRGHVVNVASIAGYVGVPHEALYSAAKAGLIAFSESARYELAGTGVGVSVVAPAAVATPYFARRGQPYGRRFPRLVSPERVADALLRAVERDLPEVFVPSWMVVPARIRGGLPRLFRRRRPRRTARPGSGAEGPSIRGIARSRPARASRRRRGAAAAAPRLLRTSNSWRSALRRSPERPPQARRPRGHQPRPLRPGGARRG